MIDYGLGTFDHYLASLEFPETAAVIVSLGRHLQSDHEGEILGRKVHPIGFRLGIILGRRAIEARKEVVLLHVRGGE